MTGRERRSGALPTLLFHMARDDATTDRWASGLDRVRRKHRLGKGNRPETDLAVSWPGWRGCRRGWVASRTKGAADEALALAERHGITLAKLWASSP